MDPERDDEARGGRDERHGGAPDRGPDSERDDLATGAGDEREPTDDEQDDDAGEADEADAAERSDEPAEDDQEALEDEFDRRGEEEQQGFPPPPDDGPLRVLPVRHLRLAEEQDDRAELGRTDVPASPYRAGPPARAWQWVPLGALVALLTTTAISAVLGAVLPESQEALRNVTETMIGVEGDEAKLEAVEQILDGPEGPALVEALVGILVAFVAGLLLAGLIVGLTGRAGAVEAGLGAGTFTLLSMLFVGGGFSAYTLPTPFLAFGLGWLGGKAGLAIRRRRAARRAL
ncbi:MAG: hypothetical protein JXB32_11345 [Deltaproteobacteria bacterium]|nr:hypothetical protein [Deltaproteobacteria bacterium]